MIANHQQCFAKCKLLLAILLLLNLTTCEAWAEYNALRRRTQGNDLILFYFLCAMVYGNQSNPAIIVPEALRGVNIRIERDGLDLVVFVRGFSIISSYMISPEALEQYQLNRTSRGAALWNRIQRYGTIQHWWSATFRTRNDQERGRILNDDNVEIAIFHRDIPELDRRVIERVPSYQGQVGRGFDRAYRRANYPGLYIDNRRYDSANAVQKIIRKRDITVKGFINELYKRYFQQRNPMPVRGTLNNVTVVCKLASMP